jgi:hypothetical protein
VGFQCLHAVWLVVTAARMVGLDAVLFNVDCPAERCPDPLGNRERSDEGHLSSAEGDVSMHVSWQPAGRSGYGLRAPRVPKDKTKLLHYLVVRVPQRKGLVA